MENIKCKRVCNRCKTWKTNIFSGGGRKAIGEDGSWLSRSLIKEQFFIGVKAHTYMEVRDGLMKDPEINIWNLPSQGSHPDSTGAHRVQAAPILWPQQYTKTTISKEIKTGPACGAPSPKQQYETWHTSQNHAQSLKLCKSYNAWQDGKQGLASSAMVTPTLLLLGKSAQHGYKTWFGYQLWDAY